MLPIKQIDIKINRYQFEAMCRWLMPIAKKVLDSMQTRNAKVDTYEVVVHDFWIKTMTQIHLGSWQRNDYGRYYNYKLSPSVALVMNELLNENKYTDYRLNEFHDKLWNALNRYFDADILKVGSEVYGQTQLSAASYVEE